MNEDEVKTVLSAAQRTMKRLAKKGLLAPLSVDEGAAIHIYTQESNFYKEMNKNLRSRVS